MAPSRLHISAASEGLQGDRLLAAELCCPPRMGLCDAAVPWASGLTGPWEWAGAWPGVGARMAHALGVRAGEMVVPAPPSLLCSFVREAPGTGAQQASAGEPALGPARAVREGRTQGRRHVALDGRVQCSQSFLTRGAMGTPPRALCIIHTHAGARVGQVSKLLCVRPVSRQGMGSRAQAWPTQCLGVPTHCPDP